MADGVRTELETSEGRPVVVKRADGPEAEGRLRREAERLRSARHPGVVELLATPADGSLVLAWVGGQTLGSTRPDVVTATTLLAAVAATVADLHQRGLVHGRLEPSHVIVDGKGRPHLCGLGTGEPDDGGPAPTEADDVAALGRLVDQLVGTGSEPEPIPDRRWGRRPWTGFQARAVQTLADQATAPDPARRPTARALATALGDLVPGGRVPRPAEAPADEPAPEPRLGPATILGMRIHEEQAGDPAPVRQRRRPPDSELRRPPSPRLRSPWTTTARRAAAALLGVAVVLLALLQLGPADPGIDEADTAADTAAPATEPPAPPATTTSAAPPRPTGCEPTVGRDDPRGGPVEVDVDGDGCPDDAAVGRGRITVGPTSYAVGRADDEVVLGDWDCDGTATPAVLRPSSGEVFVFPRWPDAGGPITLAPTTTVPAAAHLGPSTGGCGALAVRLADGTRLEVALHPGEGSS